MKREDRRLKIVAVPTYYVLDLFQGAQPVVVHDLRWAGLPEGYEILDVINNPHCRTFDFVVRHETFSEVPVGELLPRIYVEMGRVEQLDSWRKARAAAMEALAKRGGRVGDRDGQPEDVPLIVEACLFPPDLE